MHVQRPSRRVEPGAGRVKRQNGLFFSEPFILLKGLVDRKD